MPQDEANPQPGWPDLLSALDFAVQCFQGWQTAGKIDADQFHTLQSAYAERHKAWSEAAAAGQSALTGTGLPKSKPGESEAARSIRLWTFTEMEVRRQAAQGIL